MKRLLLTAAISLFTASKLFAQIPDGTTAPDFIFTDLDGNVQHLYEYLNSGKYVALEVSATWCSPCWDYHTSGVMDSLYNLHDLPGEQAWKVLFLEGDGNTTVDQLNGIGSTQGNWVAGTSFPIMNPTGSLLNDFRTSYDVNSFPSLFLICPNKKLYHDTLNKIPRGSVSTWNYLAATMCGPAGLDNLADLNPLTIYPNPARNEVVLCFSLNVSTKFSLSVNNVLGQTVATKNFGVFSPGDQSIRYDVSTLDAGVYFFAVSSGTDRVLRKKVVIR